MMPNISYCYIRDCYIAKCKTIKQCLRFRQLFIKVILDYKINQSTV
jgi:hypothetical protein